VTPPRPPWMVCNRPGCDTRLVFARRAGTSPGSPRYPYEWDDLPPFSDRAAGCHVIVAGEAFTPTELIEHYQVRAGGLPDAKARELVSGYPWRRPHRCDNNPSEPKE
jgi:hypothetical protein